MRHDVAGEVREWLQRAAEELREAEHNLTAAPPRSSGGRSFIASRLLKMRLRRFSPLTSVHSARRTISMNWEWQTASIDGTFSVITGKAGDLTPYAWRFRYPGVPMVPTEAEAAEGCLRRPRGVRGDPGAGAKGGATVTAVLEEEGAGKRGGALPLPSGNGLIFLPKS